MLLLLACAEPEPEPGARAAAPITQPSGCVTEVVAIVDTHEALELNVAPASLEADLGRPWVGTVSWGDTPATLDIQGGGSWELWRRTWYEAGRSEACVSSYAWRTTATLADDAGVLDETITVVLEGRDLWDFSLSASIDTATIAGSATSEADALQITAMHLPLDISGSAAPGAWDTTLVWSDATPLGTGWFSAGGGR
jgi:hypothetical protein